MEFATFAGGCFWCTEAIFKRLKGVLNVTSGYAGGNKESPTYEQVTNGTTGHAEAIQIEFDAQVISYDKLLEIFWATHDPTTLNKQGGDTGTQYRSIIFYHNEEQKEHSERSKEIHQKEFSDPIVTEILPIGTFYKAEEYHQNYYEENKYAPYCSIVIDPKIKKLLKEFNSIVKEEYKK